MILWEVYVEGEYVDTVYLSDFDESTVVQKLIADGWPKNLRVFSPGGRNFITRSRTSMEIAFDRARK